MPDCSTTRRFPPDATAAQLHTVAVWQQMGDRCVYCHVQRADLPGRDRSPQVDHDGAALLPMCNRCLDLAVKLRRLTREIEQYGEGGGE